MSSAIGLSPGPGGGRRGVVAGLRPEHFEDASLVADRSRGVTFKAKIDVLESMGSEFYAYFVVESEAGFLPGARGDRPGCGERRPAEHRGWSQITARLGAESKVRQAPEAELWFDSTHLHLFDPESGRSLLARNGGPTSAQAPASSRAKPHRAAPHLSEFRA